MRTLVIYPEDKSTDFLKPIYANLKNTTVVKGGVRKSELLELIQAHDKVIMLGHGAPFGLMNPRQFPDAGLFIIDGSMVNSFKNKSSCIYIWCHADQFIKNYGLSGLCSGMFISEMGEAELYGFNDIEQGLIDQSKETFSTILSKYINEPQEIIYHSLLKEYKVIARFNPIARFNFKRLHLLGEVADHNQNNGLNTEYSMGVHAGHNENGVC